MAVTGRPRKPTRLHVLNGTWRPDRHPDPAAEPQLAPLAKLPRAPKFFDDVALFEWRRVGPELVANGLLSRADMSAFTAYCCSVGRAVAAEKVLKEKGLTMLCAQGEISRPEVAIAKTAWAEVRKFAQEFGLTPSARSRVARVITPPAAANPADPWAEVAGG